jgi:hypothetical protein
MPRKKTIQPPPVEEFTLPDGTIVEIRDETCKIIGRGLHKRDAYEKKRDEVLAKVVNDYLTPKGRKKILPANDYLSNPTKFWKKIVCTGGMAASGADDSTVRRRLYKDTKKFILDCENAIKNKD